VQARGQVGAADRLATRSALYREHGGGTGTQGRGSRVIQARRTSIRPGIVELGLRLDAGRDRRGTDRLIAAGATRYEV
jgi:hypothetical protein